MPLLKTYVYLFGLMSVAEMAFSAYGFYHSIEQRNPAAVSVLWGTNLLLPLCAGLVLGALYALQVHGIAFLLTGTVVGASVYCTMTLPALVAFYLLFDDSVGIGVSLATLASVCLSNALMSMLTLLRFMHATSSETSHNKRLTTIKTRR